MFKKNSVGKRIPILRDKQIIIAAIAVSAMLLYSVPAQQFVSATLVTIPPTDEVDQEAEFEEQDLAQRLVDETRQRITQEAEQEQEQEQEQEIEQELEQSNEATISQDETNNQANVIETGDNTATTTQIGDNDANFNALSSEAEGGSGEYSSSSSGGSGSGDDEASSSIEQEVGNEAETNQDSSADDNILVNENEFGDDVAVVDQENTAEQDAANIGIQIQEQELAQEAANVNVNIQAGTQRQEAVLAAEEPDGEDGVFCFAFEADPEFLQAFCFETRAECEEAREIAENRPPFAPTQECREFATIPPGGGLCRIFPDGTIGCEPV